MVDISIGDMSTRISAGAVESLLAINVEWKKVFLCVCFCFYGYPSRERMSTETENFL